VDAADWAAVSATAAAIAALASWGAVMQTSRIQRRQLSPLLSIQAATIIDHGNVRIHVENSGGAIALGVWFWVREGAEVCVGGLPPHGSLAPGHGVTVLSALTSGDSEYQEAVVICRSGPRLHAWDAGGRHKTWRLREPIRWLRKVSNETIVHRFYPQAPATEDLEMVRYELERAD
jgi:hypothetical protein